MLHRTTWIAIPVLAAVVFGTAAGWWGYDQYRQRQALALQAENQYEGSFHQLVANMDSLQTEIGKAVITSDPYAFDNRLRDMWRLSYAAQTDIARLPYGLMPMHNVQQFLANVSRLSNDWLDANASPTNRTVNRTLQRLYDESHTISSRLGRLQSVMAPDKLRWIAVQQALTDGKSDNQMVDGFRKIDNSASTFVEANVKADTKPVPANAFRGEPNIDARTAARRLAQWAGVHTNVDDWRVQPTGQGRQASEYYVFGETANGSVAGFVTRNGGHVVTFQMSDGKGGRAYEFAEAQDRAVAWLKAHGFPDIQLMDATQYDNVGYYLFSPTYQGAPVIDRQLAVKVSLGTGRIIGFTQSGDFGKPVTGVPKRILTDADIARKLNPAFHVGMMRDVIVKDEGGHYRSAVAVYGTFDHETYRMYVDANTGREIGSDRLTDHPV